VTPLARHIAWVSLLAIGCTSSADLGGSCPTRDGGPSGSGANVSEGGATGGTAGTATSGGAPPSTGGAAGGGTSGGAGTGGSGGAGTGGSGESASDGAAAFGATGGTGGGDADGSILSSGGAGMSTGGAPGDAGIPVHCTDHRHDGDETDVDCGGSCPGCGPGLLCRTDLDCGGTAAGCGDQCYCDTATATCVYNDCFDNKTDALETDFDCGGPLCHPCELGLGCQVDTDCLSAACDLATHECIADQCADHRTDGAESDVDCGVFCASCVTGQKCNSSADCESGHFCNGSKVCQ